ncbi:conserved hypothetical protein [Gammaproteobacteria bacterium]
MQIRIKVPVDPLLNAMKQRGIELSVRVKATTGKAVRNYAPVLQSAVRDHVASRLTVRKPSFLSSFKVKVLDANPTKLPDLLVKGSIPWVSIHETGGNIGGNLLIPIGQRIGPKTFSLMVKNLMQTKRSFFIRTSNGTVVLMARTSGKEAKPFAILVSGVTIPKRLDIQGLVQSKIPELQATIEAALLEIDHG